MNSGKLDVFGKLEYLLGLFRCTQKKRKASQEEIAHYPMAPIKTNWFWAFFVGAQGFIVVIGGVGSNGSSVSLDHQRCKQAAHPIVTYRERLDL
ncbi:hypothetical protein chiPu_0003445 [Chiloscyllium punctatum]|uniref:Uncharacterized protein n=1 Tax=Chiloscyllium punctatum TaxID=137246 RepID=A0A401S3T9_CHIPU|nr:hypothetical protein [Chiloscyllium punctatum]